MVSCFGGEEESDLRASWRTTVVARSSASVISSLADGLIIERDWFLQNSS